MIDQFLLWLLDAMQWAIVPVPLMRGSVILVGVLGMALGVWAWVAETRLRKHRRREKQLAGDLPPPVAIEPIPGDVRDRWVAQLRKLNAEGLGGSATARALQQRLGLVKD